MSFQNAIIEGNFIGGGAYDGGTYSPEYCIESTVPALISNNAFATGTFGILQLSGETIVSGNDFSPADDSPLITYIISSSPSQFINNVFNGTSTGPSTQYLYVVSDSTIMGNTFEEPGGGSTFIRMADCKCIVTNNRFRRYSTSVSAYITITGTSGHRITNNDFDSNTVDGFTETLVTGIASDDFYDGNRNQTCYVTVFPSDCAYGHSYGTGVGTHTIKPSSFASSPFLLYYGEGRVDTLNSGAGILQKIQYFVNLSKMLPKNAKIVGSLVGFRWHSIGANLSSSNFSVTTSMHRTIAAAPISNPFSAPASTLAAVSGSFPSFLDENLGLQTASYTPDTTTRYLTGSYSGDNIYVNNTQDVVFRVQINFVLTASAVSSEYHLSNFIFKYVLA